MDTVMTSTRQWKAAIFEAACGRGPQVHALVLDPDSPTGTRHVRVLNIHKRAGTWRVKTTANGTWHKARHIWLASS
jgi:hypothetical protein